MVVFFFVGLWQRQLFLQQKRSPSSFESIPRVSTWNWHRTCPAKFIPFGTKLVFDKWKATLLKFDRKDVAFLPELLIITKASAFCGARWEGKAKEPPWQLQAEKCSLKTSTKTWAELFTIEVSKQQATSKRWYWSMRFLSRVYGLAIIGLGLLYIYQCNKLQYVSVALMLLCCFILLPAQKTHTWMSYWVVLNKWK